MIRSKEDYRHYLAEDLRHHGRKKFGAREYLFSPILRYQVRLRKIEYLTNCRNDVLSKTYGKLLRILNIRLGIRLGFDLPINTIGPGLCLPHYGPVIITHNASIGKNARIHVGVNVGTYKGAPRIGDNVYLGPGAKIFGDISLGNNVAVGANCVVTKSFGDNLTLAGIPAKVISEKGTLELSMHPPGFLDQNEGQ